MSQLIISPSRSVKAVSGYSELELQWLQTSVAEELKKSLKQNGFTQTYKQFKRELPKMSTVTGGVLQFLPSGKIDAALDTVHGPVVIQNGDQTNNAPIDPQSISSHESESDVHLAPDQLLSQLACNCEDIPSDLIFEVEMTSFDEIQRRDLLPILWKFILANRNSNNREKLVAVASAIRKYVATMPMGRTSELLELIDPVQRTPLPIDLELEVVKMIYRYFEARPSVSSNPEPLLAARLWEIAQTYLNPRILLRDKNAAVASMAIEALVAMRSSQADAAWRAAMECPYSWFGAMVTDNLNDLRKIWKDRQLDAVVWLDELRDHVINSRNSLT